MAKRSITTIKTQKSNKRKLFTVEEKERKCHMKRRFLQSTMALLLAAAMVICPISTISAFAGNEGSDNADIEGIVQNGNEQLEEGTIGNEDNLITNSDSGNDQNEGPADEQPLDTEKEDQGTDSVNEQVEEPLEASSDSVDENNNGEGTQINSVTTFAEFIDCLRTLKTYADAYEKPEGTDSNDLMINYIRTGVERYTTSSWTNLAGAENTDFVAYVAEQDEKNLTSASALRNLGEITSPNGQYWEADHFFGAMDIIYHSRKSDQDTAKKTGDLGSWAGDLVDLLSHTYKLDGSDFDGLISTIRSDWLGVYDGKDSFSYDDIRADLDAYAIGYDLIDSGSDLVSVLEGYYTKTLSDEARAQMFIGNRFKYAESRTRLRKDMFNAYTANLAVQALEATRNIDGSEYDTQRKATVYAFADYLSDLIGLPETAESDDDDTNPEHAIDYDKFIEELKIVEDYAAEYSKSQGSDPTSLVMNYICAGNIYYTIPDKNKLVGTLDEDFATFVDQKNAENNTRTKEINGYVNALAPYTYETENLGHLVGAIAIAYKNGDNLDLGMWAMDVADLMSYSKKNITGTNVDKLSVDIRKNALGIEKDNSFGITEIRADLDAYGIYQHLKEGKKLSEACEAYYTEETNLYSRASLFVGDRFKDINTKKGLRDAVYEAYKASGATSYEADADDLYEKAACYAWSDYLYNLAFSSSDTPETHDDTLPKNDYYSVFSSTSTNLAPGVRQTVRYANTADDKQIVYYTATADVSRDDVELYANYYNNQGSDWGLQSVSDQIAAWKNKHPDGGTPVVGTNADFFDMSTGKPGGALVLEGTQYNGIGNENFFGILKDGTPVIGGADTWYANRGNIEEAVGGGAFLIKDGKICVSAGSNYANNRASRTCVGITEDGQVVLMVLDGRQLPFSAGGSSIEIAQIMLEAGCVKAINLDGGGSTTFVAKQEGQDDISVVNRPSDGYERKVSSSLMIVSTANNTNEFDHAVLSADYKYITPGAELQIDAKGVSSSGGAAEMPDNAVWKLKEGSVGTLTSDHVFKSDEKGDATILVSVGGEVVGNLKIHVVSPDGLNFENSEITAVYGTAIPIPIIATYNGNNVLMASNTKEVVFELEKKAAGSIDGLAYTAADENCGVRSTKITAYLTSDYDVSASSTIYLYKSGEALFDFNNATGGNRQLAWRREVSNSTTEDDIVYMIDDPDQPMDISYVFALDMNDLTIPENIQGALPLLAQFLGGSSSGDITAWQLLTMLAERVSPSTTVTVDVKIDPQLEVDISNIVVNCEFFELTNCELDESNNTIKMTCNWIKVNGPIDTSTANPLCIVSGIKATVKDDAEWDENHRIAVNNSGSIIYNARVRSSQAYAIGGTPLAQQYGVSSYDNSANLAGDKGAQFTSTHATFDDAFILDSTDHEGWIKEEDGSVFYYLKNKKVTGINYLPVNDGTAEGGAEHLYYEFDNAGVLKGEFTGFLDNEEGLRYIVLGKPKTGWREIKEKTYYFNIKNGIAVNGNQKIDGYNYVFSDNVLIKGDLVKCSDGYYRYRWAGTWFENGWFKLEGNEFFVRANTGGKVVTGIGEALRHDTEKYDYHIFSAEGIWQKDANELYTTEDGNTYYAKDGLAVYYPGLVKVGEDYYYFKSGENARGSIAIKGRSYWISKTNGLLPEKSYTFDEDGKLILEGAVVPEDPTPDDPSDVKNGIVKVTDDTWYYYVNDVITYAGLIKIDNNYYYVKTDGTVIHGRNYWITKTNGLLPEKSYTFDADGKIVLEGTTPDDPDPEVKNGIVAEDNNLYYYVNGVRTYAGLIQIDGDYYYVKTDCSVVHGRSYWISKTNGLLPEKSYTFDESGKIVF